MTVAAPTPTWVYWVSRDSDLDGKLSDTCCLWYARPARRRHALGVMWVPIDKAEPGRVGEYLVADIVAWFGHERVPETDVMLLRIEQTPTKKMLDEQAKQNA